MKKEREGSASLSLKIRRVMKITAILILVGFIQLSATTYAQEHRISVAVNNGTFYDVVSQIEKQSDFMFFYKNEEIDNTQRINMKADNKLVSEILNEITRNNNLTYKISGKHIIITKAGSLNQQMKKVTGLVTDEKGEPIIGVNVVEKGTTNGTVTDLDGKFSLDVNDKAILIFSYIGYNTKDISVTAKSSLTVSLVEDTKTLDEVVVVGYGTMKKSDLTGSVSRANLESFKGAPNTNILQSMQGTIPGLNIGQVTSAGASNSIEVRGQSTINGNKEVLIVLDGVVYGGTLASINPSDILSVDVLKDASSKAIYGASAANGVLMITTRKGVDSKKPRINLSTSYAIQEPAKMLHPMNRAQKLKSITDYYWQESYMGPDYTTPNPDFDLRSKVLSYQQDGYDDGTDFDWLAAAEQTSYLTDNVISISNANKNSNYYISFGYKKQEGYMLNDDYDNKSVRINLESNVTDWLTIGAKAFGSFSDYSGETPDLRGVYLHSPLLAPYDKDGDFIYQPSLSLTNPFTSKDVQDFDKRNVLSAVFSATVKLPFLKGFSYKVNYGNNYYWNRQYSFNPWGASQKGSASKTNSSTYDYTVDQIASYSTVVNKVHSIDGTLVFGLRKKSYEYTNVKGEEFTDKKLGYNKIELAETLKGSSDAWQEQYLYQLARINYKYDDKYLLTASVRRDGFSGFSKNNQYGLFPSVAVAWVVSNESFFPVETVDYLKLRYSYGANGNLTSRYSSLARMGSNSYVFTDGGSTAFGQFVASMPSDIKWEKTLGHNVGLDIRLLKNRLSLNVDYYNSVTTDLLWTVAIPYVTGFSSIQTNLGEIKNSGLEFTLSGLCVDAKDFKWNAELNFSKNNNEVVRLLGDLNGDGQEDDLITSGLFIGKPLGTQYTYNKIGIWQIGETPYPGYYVGTEKLEDINNDGKIDAINDRKIMGRSTPNYRFGFKNTFTYKNFSLLVFINSIQGGNNTYLGNIQPFDDGGNNGGNNMLGHNFFAEIDYWTPYNPNGKYRIPVKSPAISTPIYQDRSFIRLQDVILSYNLPKSLLDKIGIENISISLAGKNLATWTKWEGWDPETGSGLGVGGLPVIRSYSLGLNVSL